MSRERERFDEIGKKIKREVPDGSTNNSSISSFAAAAAATGRISSRHMMLGGAQLNTITPCAACKLLRRRCAQECPFSPYFSPHEPQKFASVHKVFGASNVSKMLLEVPETQRADAANSLVYEANVRLRDPVYGCMGAILALQQQVQALQAELNAVSAEIIKYKYTRETTNPTVSTAITNNNNLIPSPSHHHHHHHQQLSHHHNNHLHHQMGHLLSPTTVSVAVPPPSSSTPMPPAPPSPPTAPPLPAQPHPPQQPRLHGDGASASASSIYSQSSTDHDYGATVSDNHDHNNNVAFFG